MTLERQILSELLGAKEELHGFELARRIAVDGQGRLAAHGTLYKALARLSDLGLVESAWEDPAIAESERRPRRRNYRISALGATALATAASAAAPSFGPVTA